MNDKEYKKNLNYSLGIGLFTIILLISIGSVFAVDQLVDPNSISSETVKNNISSAIDAARNGNTITIQDGIYGGLNINTNIYINRYPATNCFCTIMLRCLLYPVIMKKVI